MTVTAHCFHPSLNAYFNALLRETGPWPFHRDGSYFSITNRESAETLLLPCQYHSQGGRHILGPRALLDQGEGAHPIAFQQAVDWTLLLPEVTTQATPEALANFRQRVVASDDNLAKALGYQTMNTGSRLPNAIFEFIEAEQALVNGHSIHPCPKDRGNMSHNEARIFAPEFGCHFPLAWYSVHRDYLHCHLAGKHTLSSLVEPLLESTSPTCESSVRTTRPPGHCLIPCHPYQHQHWQSHPVIRRLQAEGKVRFLGMDCGRWQATSSLRAIWSESHDWMLKFSLSVRLTNSIRHLQPEEASRGPALARLLTTPVAQAWLGRHPAFSILKEPASVAICDERNQPLPETTLVFRDNYFRGQQSKGCEVLATLLQDDPDTGLSRLGRALKARGTGEAGARRWFQAYLNLAVKPLLDAQSNLGLLFGAHQQNLILKLDEQFQPVAAWFRDCQGTGFSSLAHQCFGSVMPALIRDSANELPDERAIRLFCYYLFVNSTFNVITALAAAGLCPETLLWQVLRQWLAFEAAGQPLDTGAIDYLLNSPELYAKNNLLCCLKALNENTLKDPTALYHPLPNPLVQEQARQRVPSTRAYFNTSLIHKDETIYDLQTIPR
jgi:N2-citryl-N6-acetyl-N6-hydroxylysine synthase